MPEHNRRAFLQYAAGSGLAAASLASVGASTTVLGANDRLRVAVVGVNSRGQAHLGAYGRMKGKVEIVYVVDPDSRLFAGSSKTVERLTGKKPKCVQDIRQALDDKNVDIVSIASPNHWHSLQAIWSCQAGKDVYVEKPCSHNVYEGRKLVEAARKYDRIVQHGTQSRTSRRDAAETSAARSGKYGRLLIAYGLSGKPRKSIGVKKSQPPPKELDFDLWLGPAPAQPYHQNLVHYNWHWFWDFGNGEIGNQGVHEMDLARWSMPDGALPKSVISLGGRFAWNDQGQTPNTQLTIIDFGGPKLIFENRDLVRKVPGAIFNAYYTEDGLIKHGMFFPKGSNHGDPLPGADEKDSAFVQRHFENFIACVRSRKREDLHADILEGHRSAALCHIANISYRLGADVPLSQHIEAFGGDMAAYEAVAAMKQHLIDDPKLALDGQMCRLGRKLMFDGRSERFIGDEQANKLLTCEYRKPYVVPEQV